jgi:C_GCAxxG_C_C family probable redox protein
MKEDKAVELFLEGYNCAQSIVANYGFELGLKEKDALKLATGLGAGINYHGQTCGAVLGSYIVLGLRYGIDQARDQEGKARLRMILDAFSEKFIKEYKSLNCKDILGMDVSREDELEELRRKNVFRELYPQVVRTAASILEKLLKEPEV